MRLVPVPRPTADMPFVLIYAVIVLLAAAAAKVALSLPAGLFLLPGCPFHALTGLPCLTCGGTRSLASLGGGHVLDALAFNPLAAVAALTCVGAGLGSAVRRAAGLPALRLETDRREAITLRFAALALIAANWVYLLARG